MERVSENGLKYWGLGKWTNPEAERAVQHRLYENFQSPNMQLVHQTMLLYVYWLPSVY
jgi:hypothetical protein